MVAAEDFTGLGLTGLASDSRQVKPGYLFAALSGSKTDGARFLSDAVAKGARAVLARPELAADAKALGVVFIGDENPRLRLAKMAAAFTAPSPTRSPPSPAPRANPPSSLSCARSGPLWENRPPAWARWA